MTQKKKLPKVFLSTSIPQENRHPKYFESADIIAIRDAIKAFSLVILPHAQLVWGGHPSITPLIRQIMSFTNTCEEEHMQLYQSKFFAKHFPKDNNRFKNLVMTAAADNRKDSLRIMRENMLKSDDYVAAVFIGGMEGVRDEYKMFTELHPNLPAFPIASTGGAALKDIYEESQNDMFVHHMWNEDLLYEYNYNKLFRNLFKDIIKLNPTLI